jgi:hypothetical protein
MTRTYPISVFGRNDADQEMYADASQLGLRPGAWPAQIRISQGDRERTFGCPRFARHDGETVAAYYHERGTLERRGDRLVIFND